MTPFCVVSAMVIEHSDKCDECDGSGFIVTEDDEYNCRCLDAETMAGLCDECRPR